MERKSKQELVLICEEQKSNLHKYKSRLHDIIGSYKNLVKEKETLQRSIKTIAEATTLLDSSNAAENPNPSELSLDERTERCIENLRISLCAMAVEKSRVENELTADRKRILQQKDDLERNFIENENNWFLEKEKYESQVSELRKKIGAQQREREKEQHDHVLMLKELQNVVASERAAKEKLEQQVCEYQQKFSGKMSDKKIVEYEKSFDELRNELKNCQESLNASKNEVKMKEILILKIQEEINEIKCQYQAKINEEKLRADNAEEKLQMLLFVKEKRIANLENRISELSAMVGENDKLRQQDQTIIQKLKARISQLQNECSTLSHISTDDSKLFDHRQSSDSQDNVFQSRNDPDLVYPTSSAIQHNENLHLHCQTELSQLREELEQYKAKCESALIEKYNKSSAALLSDAKSGKEIKELKSRLAHLQNQLQSSKSQIKLNEEYHDKITSNLEKACEDLKLLHKQEIAQLEIAHKAQLLELEHQIQKQRERTLLLLEEKDKEISLLKSSFLSSFIQKERQSDCETTDNELPIIDQEATVNILSNSLISCKKDGHLLHYAQELARKDVEISNLRQSRIQSESMVRKLEHSLAAIKEKYFDEVDALKSRIKLLESTQDQEGTNVEYLKNVVLRFLKCTDPNSRKHMINAIATILHFTTSEIQEVKNCM